MELKEILDELSELNRKANAAIPSNPATKQGHIGRKKSAQLRIPDVRKEYKASLLKHLVPIVVTGSSAKDFFEVAVEKIGILGVDGEALYKDLSNRMPKEASSGKMATKAVVDILSRHLEDVATESGVLEYPQLLHKSSKGFAIKNKQDLERLIKQSINENVGSEFSLIYNLNKIADHAIENGFDGTKPYLPVLVLVEDEKIAGSVLEGQKRFSNSSYLLTSGEVSSSLSNEALASTEKVTKESVSEALKAVKNSLKKRSK